MFGPIISDDPYWTCSKNSFEIIYRAIQHKVSLVQNQQQMILSGSLVSLNL